MSLEGETNSQSVISGSGKNEVATNSETERVVHYIARSGKMIFPRNTGPGVVQEDFEARPLGSQINRLTGYEPMEPGTLYMNESYWKIGVGSAGRFGSYPNGISKFNEANYQNWKAKRDETRRVKQGVKQETEAKQPPLL